MKKAIFSVFRLAMFVGALVLLSFRDKGPEAQLLAHQCVTFFTDSFSCPSCGCTSTNTNFPNEVITQDLNTGTFSILETNWSCGPAVKGCTNACSGTYPQSVSDSGCCIASGSACASVKNEYCCPGLICRSSGNCGVCSDTGESCKSNGDCCDSTDSCSSGTCVNHPVFTCTICPPQKQSDCCTCPCGSPIILDITGKGYSLTSDSQGVTFDISGDGKAWKMAWTAAGSDNAFLVLPGADGLVHSGQQLFGNFTPQPPCPIGDKSCFPNGFRALAVYDQPANGGNGDGIIDARDAIFSSLRLWIDANHDGISQPEELHTLSSLGINSISLNYKRDAKTDQYGNVFRYRAQVNPGTPTDAGKTAYDVFFVVLPSATAKSCPAPPVTGKRPTSSIRKH
jgi:hypothetical protein